MLALLLATANGVSLLGPAPRLDAESAPKVTRITIGGLPPWMRVVLPEGALAQIQIVDARTDSRGFRTLSILIPAESPPQETVLSTPLAGIAFPASSPILGPPLTQPSRGTEATAFAIDTFSGTSLSPPWQILNPAAADVTVSGGELHLRPLLTGSSATWFDDGEGVFVYRTVQGNFTARTHARATAVSNPNLPPAAQYRLGGILLRNPNSAAGDRNSLHLALGAGDNATPVAIEDKTTTNSNSTFFFHGVDELHCQLRIRRTGSIFTLEYRASTGAPWLLARTMNRPDLPQALQIGLMAYSFEPGADLRVSFSDFILESSL